MTLQSFDVTPASSDVPQEPVNDYHARCIRSSIYSAVLIFLMNFRRQSKYTVLDTEAPRGQSINIACIVALLAEALNPLGKLIRHFVRGGSPPITIGKG